MVISCYAFGFEFLFMMLELIVEHTFQLLNNWYAY